jgi:acid phosphatase type 7
LRRRQLTRALVVAAAAALIVLVLLPVRAVVFDSFTSISPKTGSPRPAGHDPVIAAAGDIACPSSVTTFLECHQRGTSDLIAAGGFDAVLDLGDNQYDGGSLYAYDTYYGPTWGRVKSITHPAPGNHEYITPKASGYFSYFGSAAGDPTRGYYSYDIGTWHMIALNSNCWAVGGCGAGSPEEQWLRLDLAAHRETCTLGYWHHPRFSSGTTYGSLAEYAAFWQALYEGGADVVLVGHEHSYERFAPQDPNGTADRAMGIREFVVGTGGKSLYPLGLPIANSEARNDTTFGVLELTLHPTSYDWRFVPEAGGTFTDSGTAACH